MIQWLQPACAALVHEMVQEQPAELLPFLCRVLADTPFPFPWAQIVLIMLILYALIVPLIVVAFVNRMWIGLVINFLSVQSYWSLNEVARDLEDPFVYDPNDLPLARYQV